MGVKIRGYAVGWGHFLQCTDLLSTKTKPSYPTSQKCGIRLHSPNFKQFKSGSHPKGVREQFASQREDVNDGCACRCQFEINSRLPGPLANESLLTTDNKEDSIV